MRLLVLRLIEGICAMHLSISNLFGRFIGSLNNSFFLFRYTSVPPNTTPSYRYACIVTDTARACF